MKIVYSLACFFIAGILGSSNAQEEMESLCTKYGGPGAYGALQSGIVELQGCFKTVADDWSAHVQRSQGKMDAAFELYCNRVGTLKNCGKRFMNSVKTCLAPGQHEFIDIAYNMSASLLDFGCNNSKLFEAALTSQDQPCLQSKLDAMPSCVDKFITSHNITISKQSGPLVDPIGTLSKLEIEFNSKECRQIEDIQECAVTLLEECNDKTFSKILDSLWKHINENLPCDNLNKSAASPAGVANILLLFIALIAMTF